YWQNIEYYEKLYKKTQNKDKQINCIKTILNCYRNDRDMYFVHLIKYLEHKDIIKAPVNNNEQHFVFCYNFFYIFQNIGDKFLENCLFLYESNISWYRTRQTHNIDFIANLNNMRSERQKIYNNLSLQCFIQLNFIENLKYKINRSYLTYSNIELELVVIFRLLKNVNVTNNKIRFLVDWINNEYIEHNLGKAYYINKNICEQQNNQSVLISLNIYNQSQYKNETITYPYNAQNEVNIQIKKYIETIKRNSDLLYTNKDNKNGLDDIQKYLDEYIDSLLLFLYDFDYIQGRSINFDHSANCYSTEKYLFSPSLLVLANKNISWNYIYNFYETLVSKQKLFNFCALRQYFNNKDINKVYNICKLIKYSSFEYLYILLVSYRYQDFVFMTNNSQAFLEHHNRFGKIYIDNYNVYMDEYYHDIYLNDLIYKIIWEITNVGQGYNVKAIIKAILSTKEFDSTDTIFETQTLCKNKNALVFEVLYHYIIDYLDIYNSKKNKKIMYKTTKLIKKYVTDESQIDFLFGVIFKNVELLKNSLKDKKLQYNVLREIANVHYYNQNYKKAEKYYEKYFGMIYKYLYANNDDDMFNILNIDIEKSVVEIHCSNVSEYSNYVHCLTKHKKYKKAKDFLIAHPKNDFNYYYVVGDLFFCLQDYVFAEKYLPITLIEYEHVKILHMLSKCYYNNNKINQCQEMINKLENKHSIGILENAKLFFNKKEYSKSLEVINKYFTSAKINGEYEHEIYMNEKLKILIYLYKNDESLQSCIENILEYNYKHLDVTPYKLLYECEKIKYTKTKDPTFLNDLIAQIEKKSTNCDAFYCTPDSLTQNLPLFYYIADNEKECFRLLKNQKSVNYLFLSYYYYKKNKKIEAKMFLDKEKLKNTPTFMLFYVNSMVNSVDYNMQKLTELYAYEYFDLFLHAFHLSINQMNEICDVDKVLQILYEQFDNKDKQKYAKKLYGLVLLLKDGNKNETKNYVEQEILDTIYEKNRNMLDLLSYIKTNKINECKELLQNLVETEREESYNMVKAIESVINYIER
ncbi:hypothetical protein BDAP_000603, partial [Binucleata daphniae]